MQNRRDVLAGLLAVSALPSALGGCTPDYPNLYDMLKPFKFLDENGDPISARTLKEKLGDRYVTLSFGYGGCKDYCAKFEPVLPFLKEQAEAKGDKIASIVINVKPTEQGATEATRKANLDEIRAAAGDEVEVHPVYPVDPASGALSVSELVKVINAAGGVANTRQPEKHTDMVHLFAPGGAHVAAGSTTQFLTNQWEDRFAGRSRGASR